MDDPTPSAHDIFMALHEGLPRQSCGSETSTLHALPRVQDALPKNAMIADLGCGPGSSVVPLAKALPDARFIAVDLYAPFIEELRERAEIAGCADRIDARVCNMTDLPVEAHSLDLIWCEGAIYTVGIETALAQWAEYLKPNGRIVFNDVIWLTPPAERPAELALFWSAYEGMRDDEGVRAAIAETGFQVTSSFDIPEEDWWSEYYTPLEAKLSRLEQAHAGNSAAGLVLNGTRTEIAMRRKHAAHYNYRFYCLSKNA